MDARGIRGGGLLSRGARFAPLSGLFARLFAPGVQTIIERVDRGLERGMLTAHLPDGSTRVLGGRGPGFEAELSLHAWRAVVRLATAGSVGWYQAWEAGEWEADSLAHLFALFSDNAHSLQWTGRASGPFRWAARIAHRYNRNSRSGSRRNIAAHYDLGNDFYAAWLDESMTYSSALKMGDDGLAAAQVRKLDAIAERLGTLETALEIGCGWGALARRLARDQVCVTAISLSDEQLEWARERGPAEIQFLKQDYRDVSGQYDAIASVEMVEALGREYWPDFMDCIARNLKPGGRAALQFISMADDLFEQYAAAPDFIQAYIFPGGLLIKTSEFRKLAEQRGLRWTDEHRFGHDYAKTLRAWRERFDLAVDEGRLPGGFDMRFENLWRYYLEYCEGGFLGGNIDVHQVTLVKGTG